MADKMKRHISMAEQEDLDRRMLEFANQFPDIPEDVSIIKYEHFASKTVGMALSAIQGSFITKKYICGGYQAEYAFEVHYQIAPTGASDDKRLKAVELLNAFAVWAEAQRPDIGDGRIVLGVETTSRASYLGATSDGYEDYMIPLKLKYEVNV